MDELKRAASGRHEAWVQSCIPTLAYFSTLTLFWPLKRKQNKNLVKDGQPGTYNYAESVPNKARPNSFNSTDRFLGSFYMLTVERDCIHVVLQLLFYLPRGEE